MSLHRWHMECSKNRQAGESGDFSNMQLRPSQPGIKERTRLISPCVKSCDCRAPQVIFIIKELCVDCQDMVTIFFILIFFVDLESPANFSALPISSACDVECISIHMKPHLPPLLLVTLPVIINSKAMLRVLWRPDKESAFIWMGKPCPNLLLLYLHSYRQQPVYMRLREPAFVQG